MLSQYRIQNVTTGRFIGHGEIIKPDVYDVIMKELKESHDSSCIWTTTDTVSNGYLSDLYQKTDDNGDKIIFISYYEDNKKVVYGNSLTSPALLTSKYRHQVCLNLSMYGSYSGQMSIKYSTQPSIFLRPIVTNH